MSSEREKERERMRRREGRGWEKGKTSFGLGGMKFKGGRLERGGKWERLERGANIARGIKYNCIVWRHCLEYPSAPIEPPPLLASRILMPKLCSALEIDGCLKKVPSIATLDAESVCIFVPNEFCYLRTRCVWNARQLRPRGCSRFYDNTCVKLRRKRTTARIMET